VNLPLSPSSKPGPGDPPREELCEQVLQRKNGGVAGASDFFSVDFTAPETLSEEV
jgi:hypothetical protein